MDQVYVVECPNCKEHTPIRNAPNGYKHVRCPCNNLLVFRDTVTSGSCDRPNCQRVVNLERVQLHEEGNTVPERLEEVEEEGRIEGGDSMDATVSVSGDAGLEDTLSVVGDEYLNVGGFQDSRVAELCESAEINERNFEFWRRQTLACISKFTNWQKEVKELPRNEMGVKRLKELRNKKLFEAELPKKLPRPDKKRKHDPIYRGFPTKLPQLKDNKRRQTVAESPTNYKELTDEALANTYEADCWGRLAHFPNYNWFAAFLRGYPREKRIQFDEELKKARQHWTCSECNTFEMEKWDRGRYVGCSNYDKTGCDNWGHRPCSNLADDASETEVSAWLCSDCKK